MIKTTSKPRSVANSHWPIHLILAVGAFVFVVPFIWMILTSIKTLGESTQIPPVLFPAVPQWTNYQTVLSTLPFATFYMNTILMTAGRTLGQLLFCSLAAYAFSRIEFPGRNLLFVLVLSVLMIPSYVLLIPQYTIIKNLGLLDTVQALFIPGMFSAFGTFLLRQFFLTIPKELDEAAKIDGANHFQIYWRVILPLAKPALIALAIFTILWAWNDLMWPLVVNNSLNKLTLSVGLASLQGEHITDFPVLMAGAVLATWPVLVIFIILQRYFVEGIAMTGTKG
ncbi:MAG: carbohydrate ABC transporter permease [Chloroflexi bacterium]|nr:MAG: carbohydrate ABC transporter permease [Chloroflexota bacterium]